MVAVGIVVLSSAVVGLVLVAAVAWYRHRVGRAARLAGPGSWASACVDPANPRAWRVLVIDGGGVHLRRTDGRDVRTWAWQAITRATTGPVRPVASAVTHQGLHLVLDDGASAQFLFPSRSTLRYPVEILGGAMRELARYGKADEAHPQPGDDTAHLP
jgi:hypothetical protein